MTRRRLYAGGEALPLVAVPKGALFPGVLACLAAAGYDTAPVEANERRQLFPQERIMTMRPSDVVTYVAEGAADIGIVGKDVIIESPLAGNVYELTDLRFGACRMMLATLAGEENAVDEAMRRLGTARIGSKYPRTTAAWAEDSGRSIDIIELKGSVELAAVVGLADGIVDLVDTGKTLTENGLVEREWILDSSARVIANSVSYAHDAERLDRLTVAFSEAANALV